jgi:tripartite-type tricarboxylate transporter receptor subunit TctC
MRRREFITRILTLGLVLAIGLVAAQANAQTWPQRTVRVILPLPPGTATDIAARLFAQRLAERWGQPVIVENRQGGDGIPAVMSFLAARDNHTLMFSFAGVITINPLIHDKLPYDPARDLVPVASVVDNFFAIAASAALKVASLEDFVRLVRSQPGKLNWAATPGLPDYIFAALQRSAGIKMTQVSYRDFTPALQDLGEGRIHVAVSGLAFLLPQVQTGKAKLLMVTNHERAPLAPDIPTAQEAGYPDLTFDGCRRLLRVARHARRPQTAHCSRCPGRGSRPGDRRADCERRITGAPRRPRRIRRSHRMEAMANSELARLSRDLESLNAKPLWERTARMGPGSPAVPNMTPSLNRRSER